MSTLSLRHHSGGLGLSPRRRAVKGVAPPAIVQDGLVAEWRFDNGSGQTLTDYKGGRHGTLGATSGAAADDPTWTAQGLSFDGGDFVTLPTMPAIQAVDVVFHVGSAVSRVTSGRMLISHGNGSDVVGLGSTTGFLTNEIISIIQDSSDYGSNRRVGWTHPSDTIAAGWHLIQIDFRSGVPTWDIVLDGVSKANAIVGTPVAFISGPWWFGQHPTGASKFIGQMAHVVAYSSARSSAQVAQNRAALTSILAARGITLP